MANLNDPQQLEQVLEALGANNTQTIRHAETLLKPFLKTLHCLPALLHQLEFSTNESVRLVTALILKKRSAKSDSPSILHSFQLIPTL
jgi:sulfite reductase alpha subunit-like flavoprotein